MGKQLDFVVNDRRGRRGEEVAAEPVGTVLTITEVVAEPSGSKSSWKDVAFMTAFAQSEQGILPIGRAVGVREDGRLFIADWLMPPHWRKGTDWMALAKARLDTFLGCDCNELGTCATHKVYVAGWVSSDTERINRLRSEPLPLAIETLMRAEMARQQSKIVVPGR